MKKVLVFSRKANGLLAVGELDYKDALQAVSYGQSYLRSQLGVSGVVLAMVKGEKKSKKKNGSS